jgi:hypothetical protein
MEHPARKQRDPAGGESTPDTGPVEGRFGDGPDSAKPTARPVLWPVRVRAAAHRLFGPRNFAVLPPPGRKQLRPIFAPDRDVRWVPMRTDGCAKHDNMLCM